MLEINPDEKFTCYFCKAVIEPEEFTKWNAVLLRNPKKELVGAHMRHRGVQQEYDSYLNIKPKKAAE